MDFLAGHRTKNAPSDKKTAEDEGKRRKLGSSAQNCGAEGKHEVLQKDGRTRQHSGRRKRRR